MTTGKRVLVVVGALAAFTVLVWALVIGAVYASGGVLTVRVQDADEGTSLFIPVPVAVVDAAVAAIPAHELDEMIRLHADLGDLQPALRDVLRELDRAPDFTLVEIEDGATRVLVRKEGSALRVDVRDPEIRVRVSVPTRFASRTVGRLVS